MTLNEAINFERFTDDQLNDIFDKTLELMDIIDTGSYYTDNLTFELYKLNKLALSEMARRKQHEAYGNGKIDFDCIDQANAMNYASEMPEA